ncbi:MAG: sirohydrochlorin cobaltochelatase, partial [Desulfobacula sp.]|nr:sirohydrochlorin cobaltochelatase [Desulfobacula sp.]
LLIEKIVRSGIRQVTLVPFMLVAGVHVEEDLKGDEDSWKKAFNEKDIAVMVEKKGVGYNKQIIELFINHIQHALDVIPQSIQ